MIVSLSAVAIADLDAIYDWISRDDPHRARTFVDELIGAAEGLSELPLAYPMLELKSGRPARRRAYGNYLIVFEVTPTHVEVLTVVHGARDLDALL